MPKKERSIESRLKEHKKFRRQCEVRIASSKKLILISLLIAASLTWYVFEFWKIGAGLIILSVGSTLMEMWGYKKHDRTIDELSKSHNKTLEENDAENARLN